jgi:nicotinamidase/pyrazinamidase
LDIKKSSALILVDLQNDFFPGGALGVPGANALFPLANTIQKYFPLVVATQDWHPANHGSFVTEHPGHALYDIVDLNGVPQILWPPHCIQGSAGAEFHPQLKRDHIAKIIHKGTDPKIDSYSTFFDNAHQKHTGLAHYLKEHQVTDVFIMGLATDYCVLFSAIDSLALGFKTYVIQDGCFGIDEHPGDVARALEKMQKAGATLIKSDIIVD